MRKMLLYFQALLVLFYACNQNRNNAREASESGGSSISYVDNSKHLFAKMEMSGDTIQLRDSAMLSFTVFNTADTIQQFCKWHTPFEPLLNKYLIITDDAGNEVNYIGPMAKRVMPPPDESYLTVYPNDSLTSNVDLIKAYDLKKKGHYTIKYIGENISGILVRDEISFAIGDN